MSASSSSDDDFAAELEAGMATEVSPVPAPAVAAPARVVVAPAPAPADSAVSSLLKTALQRAELREFTSENAGDGGARAMPGRREVKRRRVPPPSRGDGAAPSAARSSAPASTSGRASTCPPHPGFMMDVCVACGKRRERGERGDGAQGASTAMRYIHEGLEMSSAELDRAKAEEKTRVLNSGKLLVVLDLDHTLLNSARFSELSQEQHDALGRVIAARQCADAGGSPAEIRAAAEQAIAPVDDVPPFSREREETDGGGEGDEEKAREDAESLAIDRPGCSPPLTELHCLRHLALFTKLRPAVRTFLAEASRLAQLYVYTMGDKHYAAEMARILDPGGAIFNGRVISAGDSTDSRVKDLDIVLGAESAVLIVDDTDRVWPKNLRNLIRVDRYHFFSQSAEGFRQKGEAVMDDARWADEGENGNRAQLLDVLEVIRIAHGLFFSSKTETETKAEAGVGGVSGNDGALESRDVRELLANPPPGGPLEGTRLAMSRVVSRREPRPERHPLWLLARGMGAEVGTETVAGSTTHVVSGKKERGARTDPTASLGATEKMKWARRNDAHAVDADWLLACAAKNERAEEAPHSMFKGEDPPGANPTPPEPTSVGAEGEERRSEGERGEGPGSPGPSA